jgi:Resolvase, N terminal domain
MRIGYARVSTDDQTLDLQRDALRRAKCRYTYEEHASGKNTARPKLDGCLKTLRKGDTLVVWRLDRLGRSLRDLIQLTQERAVLATLESNVGGQLGDWRTRSARRSRAGCLRGGSGEGLVGVWGVPEP